MVDVPQSSVLGPLLFDLICNEVLVLLVSVRVTIIDFTNDLAMIVVATQPAVP